jgi:site-specific recombinase XerC
VTPDGPAGPRGGRAIPRARLDKLFVDDRRGLRERVLWRMLYETAARAEELLSLNVEDLDLVFRRAPVTSKGGAIEYVRWGTSTGRLCPACCVAEPAARSSSPTATLPRPGPGRPWPARAVNGALGEEFAESGDAGEGEVGI